MRTLIGLACMAWLLCWSGQSGAQTPNACGCYTDDKGACMCGRKAKCGCPGECEPMGCEAKRDKQAEKEAAAELRRIATKAKKRAAEAAKVAKDKEKTDKAAEKTALKAADKGENKKQKASRTDEEILNDIK